jgi:hypothetical protein
VSRLPARLSVAGAATQITKQYQHGGGGRTRTCEAMRRLIYSQLPLPLGTLPRSHRGQGVETTWRAGRPTHCLRRAVYGHRVGGSQSKWANGSENTVNCLIIYGATSIVRNLALSAVTNSCRTLDGSDLPPVAARLAVTSRRCLRPPLIVHRRCKQPRAVAYLAPSAGVAQW